MISISNGRVVNLSTDYGVSWTPNGHVPTNANWHWPLCAIEFNGAWAVVDQCDTSVTVNRLLYSTDLNVTLWTIVGSSVGGANSGYIRRMCCNSSVLVLLPDQNTLFGYWHPADANVSTVRIVAADGTRTGWRGAWNEQIGLFLAGNAQGDLWTSTDGISWAQIANNDASLSVRDILAHGRGFVISNGVNVGVDYLDFDRKGNYRLRNIYTGFAVGGSNATSYFHLARMRGRWVAARVLVYFSGADIYEIEWLFGDVNPFDANNVVGR
jgi:hypothetical protein